MQRTNLAAPGGISGNCAGKRARKNRRVFGGRFQWVGSVRVPAVSSKNDETSNRKES